MPKSFSPATSQPGDSPVRRHSPPPGTATTTAALCLRIFWGAGLLYTLPRASPLPCIPGQDPCPYRGTP